MGASWGARRASCAIARATAFYNVIICAMVIFYSRKRPSWVPVPVNREFFSSIETLSDRINLMDFSSINIQNDPVAKEMVLKLSVY